MFLTDYAAVPMSLLTQAKLYCVMLFFSTLEMGRRLSFPAITKISTLK